VDMQLSELARWGVQLLTASPKNAIFTYIEMFKYGEHYKYTSFIHLMQAIFEKYGGQFGIFICSYAEPARATQIIQLMNC
jgi:hypothetical protein